MSRLRIFSILIIQLLIAGALVFAFNVSHTISISLLISIVLFGVLFFLFLSIYKSFFKIKNTGLIIASAHFILICVFSVIVYLNRNEAQFQLLWFFPEKIDFPVSLLAFNRMIPIISKFMGDSYDVRGIYAPFVFFALFGSFQYYVVGKIIDLVALQLKKRKI